MSLTLTLKDNCGTPVSGEGTSITLNNTTETNFTKFDLYGDTEQTTYSGKNLFKLRPTATTTNTLTFTPNDDGSFDLSGTPTAATEFSIVVPIAESGIIANQQYIINTNVDNIGTNKVLYYVHSSDSTGVWKKTLMAFTSNDSVATCLEPTNDGYIKFVVRVASGFNATASGIKTQLVKGTTAGTWEPYVGGTASPNPDYPQEVKTVTGEQTITVSNGQGESQAYPINLGKNLYEGSPSFDSFSGISAWEDGGTYNDMPVIKRAAAWSGAYRLINIVAGVTYTFSAWVKSDEARQVAIYAIGSGATATISPTNKTLTTSTSWERVSFTFTCTTSGTIALRFENTSASETNYTYISGYQLELGSSITTYSPYITAFGKNLFDKDNFPSVDGFIRADNYTLTSSASNKTTYIKANPNTTYTFSGFSLGVALVVGTFNKVPALGDVANVRVLKGASDTTVTITTGTSDSYIAFMYQTSSDTLDTSAFQIEKGSSASTYEPNISGQLELCEIGDYQDYLYKSEGNWYVHKETWNYTFDGSSDEQWIRSGQSTSTNFIAGMVNLQNFAMIGGDANSGYCNYFDFSTYLDDNKVILSGYQSGGYRFLLYRFPSTSTVTDLTSFTTWLGNNHLKMVLVLSTAADYKITYEPLVAQLEALYNTAHSYNGATIVTSSSQYLPAIMDVTVGGSMNEVTYTETELSNPLTITDIEGKSQNTTLNGNIYVDYVYNKKSFSVSIFNLKSADYATIRGFYDRQFTLNEFPLLSIPELSISEMPVFFEIGSREINSQCIVTDKLTLKFRETAQQ